MATITAPTANSLMVLEYLKREYGVEHTKQEIASALNISVAAVTGTVNNLVKKGLLNERLEEVEVEPATETRKAKMRVDRYEMLNEAGLAYDPMTVYEERKAAEAAERAAKRAAKEAAAE